MLPRVCLIADFSLNIDEGMKRTAHELSERISCTCESIRINSADILKPQEVARIVRFRPDIIHYFHGPTAMSILGLRVLKLITRAKTVVSATHPRIPVLMNGLGNLLRADLILVQSRQSGMHLSRFASYTRLVPSGVDLEIFKRVSPDERNWIRADLGIGPDEKVGLHAGALVPSRNLDWLARIRSHLDQMIVLGSTSTPVDQSVYESLVRARCNVHHSYIRDIHKYFQAADIYVFPTDPTVGSVVFPLTILEAMACGLPVITYPASSVTEAFTESYGLVFIRGPDEIGSAMERAMGELDEEKQRQRVEKYSWSLVTKSVIEEYCQLVGRTEK